MSAREIKSVVEDMTLRPAHPHCGDKSFATVEIDHEIAPTLLERADDRRRYHIIGRSIASVASRPNIASPRNIIVPVGICARNSIISLRMCKT